MQRLFKNPFILMVFTLAVWCNGLALASIPNDVSLAKAVDLYYQGSFEASLAMLNEVVARDPEDHLSRANLVRLLREAGFMDEAMLHLHLLSSDFPGDHRHQLALQSAAYLAAKPDASLSLAHALEAPEANYWRGLALLDLGQTQEAREALERLVASVNFFPLAYATLGEIALSQGDYFSSEAYLLKALAQEPNLTSCFLPLAKASMALDKPQSAIGYLNRAKNITPWDPVIPSLIQEIITAYPEVIPSPKPSERDTFSKDFTVPSVNHWPSNRDKAPEVRIGLVEGTRQVLVKTGDDYRLMKGNRQRLSGEGQTILRIRWNNGLIEVYDEHDILKYKSTAPLKIVYKDPGATTALFDVEYGKGSFWAGKENRSYRGVIEFLPTTNGITIVNNLNMEEYLYSVVPSEVSARWPQAVLEAQAIAARTYAFARLGKNPKRGFDLHGSVASQAYNGIRTESAATNDAVDATQGIILTYNNRPISAFYSANSGGYSEVSQNVWGMELPYLKTVPDPQLSLGADLLSPDTLTAWLSQRPQTFSNHSQYSARSAYRWTLWLTRDTLERRLADEKLGRIISIVTLGRSQSGRVKQVRFRGEDREIVLPGTVVRTKLGLRSTLFTIEPKLGSDGLPEAFLLTGAGWGHGVGMCQSGAAGMAAAGYTFQEILGHYYPDTVLTSKY